MGERLHLSTSQTMGEGAIEATSVVDVHIVADDVHPVCVERFEHTRHHPRRLSNGLIPAARLWPAETGACDGLYAPAAAAEVTTRTRFETVAHGGWPFHIWRALTVKLRMMTSLARTSSVQ